MTSKHGTNVSHAMSHALLYIAGSIEDAPIPETLRSQSADVEHVRVDAFGIDDARRLFDRAHLRAVAGSARAFVVASRSMTSEAQNALLKLFEEPPAGVSFHLILPREDLLLATLRSRLQFAGSATDTDSAVSFTHFLQSSYAERMVVIAARAKEKDSAWFEAIAAGAERQMGQTTDTSSRNDLSKSVKLLRRYLGARGASSKMLLEEIALTLPVEK